MKNLRTVLLGLVLVVAFASCESPIENELQDIVNQKNAEGTTSEDLPEMPG